MADPTPEPQPEQITDAVLSMRVMMEGEDLVFKPPTNPIDFHVSISPHGEIMIGLIPRGHWGLAAIMSPELAELHARKLLDYAVAARKRRKQRAQ